MSVEVDDEELPEDADDEPLEVPAAVPDTALPDVVVAALGAVPDAVVVPSWPMENVVAPYGVAVVLGAGDAEVLVLTATEVVAGAIVAVDVPRPVSTPVVELLVVAPD